jgi:hypothetical protein
MTSTDAIPTSNPDSVCAMTSERIAAAGQQRPPGDCAREVERDRAGDGERREEEDRHAEHRRVAELLQPR